jgi:hypothetical protein
MTAKTVVVTGASAGMGRALAGTYLERGDNVVLVARGQPTDLPSGGRAQLISADLSVIADNERVVAQIKESFASVDVLIFGARHFNSQRLETVDGVEHNLALFYLSRFILAEGLMAELEQSPRPIVMNLAGPGAAEGEIQWDDLGLSRGYHGGLALGQGGRLNDLLGVSFAQRHPDARTRYVLFHPGVVSTSFSGTYDDDVLPMIENLRQSGKPVHEAIRPILEVLDAPPADLLTAFVEGRPFPVTGPAFDPADAERLYLITQSLLPAHLREAADQRGAAGVS